VIEPNRPVLAPFPSRDATREWRGPGRGPGGTATRSRPRRPPPSPRPTPPILLQQPQHIEECLRRFAVALEDFARRHAARVRAAPAFRDRFARLCAEVGVDPLAHRKTAWSALGLGDYYMGLAIQVVEACLAARATSGGVLPLPTVVAAVRRRRAGSAAGAAAGAATAGGGAAASSSSSTVGGLLAPGLTGGAGSGGGGGAERGGGFESAAASEVTEEDVRVAIRRLGALGGGFVLVSSPPCPRTGAPGAEWVRSVPGGLDSDAGAALSAARAAGAGGPREAAAGASSGLTARDLAAAAGWGGGEGEARARRCLDGLAASGAAWVDGGAPDGVARYWLPGATAGAERAGGVGP